jgi:hypothetical protein
MHFDVRKESIENYKKIQSKQYEVTIYNNVSTKGNVSSLFTLKISCKLPYFHIGMGSSPLTGQ